MTIGSRLTPVPPTLSPARCGRDGGGARRTVALALTLPVCLALGALVAVRAGVTDPRGRAETAPARTESGQTISAAAPALPATFVAAVARASWRSSRHATPCGRDVAPPATGSATPVLAPIRGVGAPARAPLLTAADASAPPYDATAPPAHLCIPPRFS